MVKERENRNYGLPSHALLSLFLSISMTRWLGGWKFNRNTQTLT